MPAAARIRPLLSLAFYRAEQGGPLDRMIADLSHGDFSHVELVFADNFSPLRPPVCCSVSWRDGGKRYKRIRVDGPEWLLVPVKADDRAVNHVDQWCQNQAKGRYDVARALGIRIPLLPRLFHWRTSAQFCGAALQQIGLLPGVDTRQLTPSSLLGLMEAK
jgi:hypothetical protein